MQTIRESGSLSLALGAIFILSGSAAGDGALKAAAWIGLFAAGVALRVVGGATALFL